VTQQARLVETLVPDHPTAVVLVLHGGGSRRANMMVSPAQLSVLRMVPIAEHIAHVGRDRLAVFRLLNSVRGWDTKHTPVDDARWAMTRLRDRFGGALPTCLVGHSLGGRAALLAADEPDVRSAVALAPWVYPDDGAGEDLTGRRILIVHGAKDRVARPANSAAVARTLGRTAEVGYIRIADGRHAMLRHHALFTALATDFVLATMLEEPADGPVARVLAGQEWIEI
jgi:pimeloyl-ACP methyl ester carboxylesterase